MSTAGKSYEAWKEAQMLAEAAGDEAWREEGSGPVTWVGVGSIVEMKGILAGLLLGGGLLFAGIATLLPNYKHFTIGGRTVGTIVGHRDYINRRSNSLVTPVVRYSAPGGVFDSAGCLSVPRSMYPPGKEVTVLYLSNNPSNAVIVDFYQMFLIPTIVGGLGLVCLIGTAGIMFLVVRSELPSDTARHPARFIPPAPTAPGSLASVAWKAINASPDDQSPTLPATSDLEDQDHSASGRGVPPPAELPCSPSHRPQTDLRRSAGNG